jgi:hypothetical protein
VGALLVVVVAEPDVTDGRNELDELEVLIAAPE